MQASFGQDLTELPADELLVLTDDVFCSFTTPTTSAIYLWADSAYCNAVIENPVVLTGSCLTLAFLLLPWPKDEWRGIKPNPNQPSARITFHRFSNGTPRSLY